jgi:hypothetical protein
MDKQFFTIKTEHLKLLRATYISWDDCEFGAPEIDCKRPYGNSDVYGDMGEILGITPEGRDGHELFFTDEQQAYMNGLHEDLRIVLQIILRTETFKEGDYQADKYDRNWKLTSNSSNKSCAEEKQT